MLIFLLALIIASSLSKELSRHFTQALTNPEETVIELTPESVESIHHQGGTILRSARGGFNADNILQWCINWNVNQIYVVGGDGSHRGANALFAEIQKRVFYNLNHSILEITYFNWWYS